MDFRRSMKLEFDVPDHEHFPCLGLAYRALEGAGTLPAVMNAANEEAVAAFLEHRIPFPAIAETIAEVMDGHAGVGTVGLNEVLDADRWARARALERLAHKAEARIQA
jgi:1-deoxy-D-xylulose-5-phosphate reductoisomerase